MPIFAGETYSHAEVLTKHDSNAQGTLATKPSDAVYVGGAGHIAVQMSGGAVCLISAVPAGTLLPIRITRLYDTNGGANTTTATLVVALWH
jgi:hypothetical protein